MSLKRYKLISVAGLTALFLSCETDCHFPDDAQSIAPGWVCNTQDSKQHQAVGFAEHSAAGYSFMKQIAAANARQQLAIKLNKLQLPPLTHTELLNTRILETAMSPQGNLYVLVGYDKADN